MARMKTAHVIPLGPARDRRIARAVDARRGLLEHDRRARHRRHGRVWVNGSELGGARVALGHLGESYD